MPHPLAFRSVAILAFLATVFGVSDSSSFAESASRAAAQLHAARESGKVSARALGEIEARGRTRLLVGLSVQGDLRPRAAGRRARITSARERVLSRLKSDPEASTTVTHRYEEIAAVALEGGAAALRRLALDPEVAFVAYDEPGSGHLSAAVPVARINEVQAQGASGIGVTIAVIDSGVDTDHPDLAGAIVAEQCFCSDGGAGCCPGGGATQSGPGAAEDDHGHGTNVTGILAGRGNVAGAGGAPAASIVAIKVLDENNGFCCVSDVIAALDYVIANHPEVDIVNMSLGTFSLFAGDCDATSFNSLLADPIDTLRASGVLVFASSGNESSSTSMSSPACVANTISVAASWDATLGFQSLPFFGCSDAVTGPDVVTCFSNTNDRTDLVAPGAPTTASGLFGGTSTFYGTSQASPLAASCAALLRELRPDATADEIEAALENAPVSLVDADNGVVLPRLDCAAALDQCGDGVITADEVCDDRNLAAGDGCDASCNVEPGFTCVGEPSRCGEDSVAQPLAGRRLAVKNRLPEDKTRNRLSWVARDAALRSPAPGSAGDPRCIGAGGGGDGARLSVASPNASESFDAPLPCEGWRAIGDPEFPRGYRYLDRDRAAGPCRSVVLRDGLSARARCSGPGVALDLSSGISQAPLRVQLTLGDAAHTLCSEFGGRVVRDGSDGAFFLARNASPPGSCP